MTVTAEEITQYEGQKVVIVRNLPDAPEAVELEGTAEKANALGVLLKPKGRQNLELIEMSEIEEIRFVSEKPKELKPAELKLVGYGNARKHLADRHGLKLSEVKDLTEEDALIQHNETDHSDVSHVHVEKKADDKKDETPDEE